MSGSVRERTTTANAAAWSERILLSRMGSRSGPLSRAPERMQRRSRVAAPINGRERSCVCQAGASDPAEGSRPQFAAGSAYVDTRRSQLLVVCLLKVETADVKGRESAAGRSHLVETTPCQDRPWGLFRQRFYTFFTRAHTGVEPLFPALLILCGPLPPVKDAAGPYGTCTNFILTSCSGWLPAAAFLHGCVRAAQRVLLRLTTLPPGRKAHWDPSTPCPDVFESQL